MSPRIRTPRRAVAALVAAAALGLPGSALAQTPHPSQGVGDVPSVAVVPADSKPDDPNGGQWFAIELQPGQVGTLRAKVGNPARVAQQVTFSIQDLQFADDGTPSVRNGEQQGVGRWGLLPSRTLVIQPQQIFTVPFQIRVPADADPGDHVGVLVATTTNMQGGFRVHRRVATRLYVTVPGDTTAAYVISSVEAERDSTFFPRTITSRVVLRNEGRVRLQPTVTVRGTKASGPRVLLSRSVETYVAETTVPWYGGIVRLPVHVETDDGLVRTASKTVVVVPYGLIIGLGLTVLATWLSIRWWRRRTDKVAGLRADIERLERMVGRPPGPPPPAISALRIEVAAADQEDDERHALVAALTRAQRGGATASVARLALNLHESGADASSWLVSALRAAETPYRGELLAALAASDPVSVSAELGRSASDKALLAEVARARQPAAVRPQRTPRPRKAAPAAPGTPGRAVPRPRATRDETATRPASRVK